MDALIGWLTAAGLIALDIGMTLVTWYLATSTGPSKTSKLIENQWNGPLGKKIQTDFGDTVIAKMQAQAKPADMMAPLIAGEYP